MYGWARGWGLGELPSFLSAMLIMFSGAHFPHIYAGHLPNLCTMTWVPLVFMCWDRLMDKPQPKWVLIGIAALSMLILAGHPQYVYYTAMVSVLYVLVKIIFSHKESRPVLSLTSILVVSLGAALICAVQIWAGVEAARESVRAKGVPYAFAAMFSLPPENLLTFLVPNIFGDLLFHPYWGRTYYWEANLFLGIGGLTLALYAFFKGGKKAFQVGITALICLILSLGCHTFLFDLFYCYLPGFGQFRGTAKFIFFVDLFLSLLAGAGLQTLLHEKEGQAERGVVLSLLGCSLMAALAAGVFYAMAGGRVPTYLWEEFLHFIARSGESYLPRELYFQVAWAKYTAALVAFQLLMGAITFLLTAGAWWIFLRRRGPFIYWLVFLAALEVMVVAGMTITSFDVKQSLPEGLVKFLAGVNKSERVLNLWRPNMALSTRVGDIWGYDPGVPKRYAEFMNFTQGGDARESTQYVNFQRYHPLWKLTRLKYIILPTKEGFTVHEINDSLPHVLLVYEGRYVKGKEAVLEEMGKPSFDPRRVVILEDKWPVSSASCSTPGMAKIKVIDTDTMEIEAETYCPTFLLITDSFSTGWRARSLIAKNVAYPILRADYTFMAIPVSVGRHHIRLEYLPRGYMVGRWISFLALALYALSVGLFTWRKI